MKIWNAVAIAFVVGSSLAFAEDAKKATSSTYLENLQTKLEHVARRANQPTSTGSSVAGLRGSKQAPMSQQLYWKGKVTESPVSIEEVKDFRGAVEEARAGKVDVAVQNLKAFLDKYPKSGLKPDVEETLKVLTAPAQAS